MHLGAENLIKL